MSDDLNTLLIRMAGYPLYEQLLDTPGLAKDFNDLCNMAKDAATAVAAERKRIAARLREISAGSDAVGCEQRIGAIADLIASGTL